MRFQDKNGREINTGDHIAWQYGKGGSVKEGKRRVGVVTACKAKKGPDGTIYRVVVHLSYPFTRYSDWLKKEFREWETIDTSFSSTTGTFSTIEVVDEPLTDETTR